MFDNLLLIDNLNMNDCKHSNIRIWVLNNKFSKSGNQRTGPAGCGCEPIPQSEPTRSAVPAEPPGCCCGKFSDPLMSCSSLRARRPVNELLTRTLSGGAEPSLLILGGPTPSGSEPLQPCHFLFPVPCRNGSGAGESGAAAGGGGGPAGGRVGPAGRRLRFCWGR